VCDASVVNGTRRMPGEPFVEFGLNFRDRAPAAASYCRNGSITETQEGSTVRSFLRESYRVTI